MTAYRIVYDGPCIRALADAICTEPVAEPPLLSELLGVPGKTAEDGRHVLALAIAAWHLDAADVLGYLARQAASRKNLSKRMLS